jgi:hypothetical protein
MRWKADLVLYFSGQVYMGQNGEMAERLKAIVSKTIVPVSGTVGSNPTLSATGLDLSPFPSSPWAPSSQ